MSELPPARRLNWNRFLGTTLIVAGVLGLVLSFIGLILVARVGSIAQSSFARQISTLDQALTATADGLSIAENALGDTEEALASLSSTLTDATQAISDTQPALETLQDLTGTSLPEAISSSRQALASAQETARVADQVLGALSFLGLRYNPEVPLNEAIGEVSASLADVPTELTNVAGRVGTASSNLDELTTDLEIVARDVDAIGTSVQSTGGVVAEYQRAVSTIQTEVAALREAAPGWITLIQWVSYLLLVWLALAQLSLLAYGRDLRERAEQQEAQQEAANRL
jgi:phage-related protein